MITASEPGGATCAAPGTAAPINPDDRLWHHHEVTARISHTSVDARDAYAQSVFWTAVLGYEQDPDDPNEPGDEECLIRDPAGTQRLLFIEVPEGKQVKNPISV